jgi:hypothetical protein
MSSPLGWALKLFTFSSIIIFASLYWAGLGSTWVAIQLIMLAVPLVLVQFQTKDAEGRAIKAPTRKPNPWIIGSSIRYSQAGGRFGLFFAIVVGTLIAAADAEDWWTHVGLTSMRQLVVVRASACVALYYLFAYICRRWPDKPAEKNKA